MAKNLFLSDPLLKAIIERLTKKEQTLLYINRRGYAPLTLCTKCGYRIKCRQCSTWLVEHRSHNYLVCHYCGYQENIPQICPDCQNEHSFAAWGPGIERIEEEVKKHFPEARTALMSSDHLTTWNDIQDIIQRFENHQIDILIGTQMATKGYHFPLLTLVGVIDGDNGLAGGDPRMAERTYQLLHQVGGRAGRAHLKGEVLIQSFVPDQPLLQALIKENRQEFIDQELNVRQEWGLPPFGRLANILLSGRNQAEVIEIGHQLARIIPIIEGIQVLGPVEAPIVQIRGYYRQRFLIKALPNLSIQKYLHLWIDQFKTKSSVSIDIDVDPYNFL